MALDITQQLGEAPYLAHVLAGTFTNGKMSVSTVSTTATFTADNVLVGSSVNGSLYSIDGFSQVINLAAVGAGGMDTGTVPVTGYIALYAIYNVATNTSALLAVNATSSIMPKIYGGANMPAGYSASCLVSIWPIATSKFIVGRQIHRSVSIPPINVLTSTTTQVTPIALSISSAVPQNAYQIIGQLGLGIGGSVAIGNALTAAIFMDSLLSGGQSTVLNGAAQTSTNFVLYLNVPQQVFYTISISGGPTSINTLISISAYEF